MVVGTAIPKKPLYSGFLTSQEFQNKDQAQDWAKDQKRVYKQAGMSVKHDITRTVNSGWKVSLFAKV